MINPLLNTAEPFFTFCHLVSDDNLSPPNADALKRQLLSMIKQFDAQLNEQQYDDFTRNYAAFFLGALIDETIQHASFATNNLWRRKSFAELFQTEIFPHSCLFNCLEQCLENPDDNIDLIELCYYCLELGYQGKYRHANDTNGLKQAIDRCLTILKAHNRTKAISDKKTWLVQPTNRKQWKFIPIWLSLSLGILISTASIFHYHQKLQPMIKTIDKHISALKQDHEDQSS